MANVLGVLNNYAMHNSLKEDKTVMLTGGDWLHAGAAEIWMHTNPTGVRNDRAWNTRGRIKL